MNFQMFEIFAVMVFFTSFYGLITSRNAIKSIICITVMEISVIMFFLTIGYESGMVPPIGTNPGNASDPLPQALMITAIIIGVAVTAVNLIMLISLCRQSKTTDWRTVQKMNIE